MKNESQTIKTAADLQKVVSYDSEVYAASLDDMSKVIKNSQDLVTVLNKLDGNQAHRFFTALQESMSKISEEKDTNLTL